MSLYHNALNVIRMSVLLVGSIVIFVGVVQAVPEVLRSGSSRLGARRALPNVGLGLEFFVGATILNLILNPTWMAVGSTALTILVRKLITFSLSCSGQFYVDDTREP
ncbi:MAG: DUF1622 domain-containing protein [Rubrobacter sp.]|nr:DUF1622 domain-containing protein [Rubrobacter sp.]